MSPEERESLWRDLRRMFGAHADVALNEIAATVDQIADARADAAVRAALEAVAAEVHAIRFADQEGTLRGPDNFYNGAITSERIVRAAIPPT